MSRCTDWAVVVDVDGTLTHQKTGGLPHVVDRHALAAEGCQELQVLRDRFLALTKLGQLSHAQEMFWLNETFRIYAQYGLTRSGWQSAIDTVELREGVVETFTWLAQEGIPTAAISYGCADFVEHLLVRHGIRVDAIYAGRMRHEGDLVTGVDCATLVIPEHKGERSRHFADVHGVPHDQLLAAGDSGGDRLLGHLLERRVMISDTEEGAEKMRGLNIAHEVHVTQSFYPVTDFFKRHIGSSS